MMVEAQVVLANASVVTASATQNPDLFWALRGAGSSFGIVTQFKFNTFAAPTNNVVFNYNLPMGSNNVTLAASVIDAVQKFGNSNTPPELNMRVLCNGYSNQLLGVYYGTVANFNTTIRPLLQQLNMTFASGNPQNVSWLTALSTYAYDNLSPPLDYNVHEAFVSAVQISNCFGGGEIPSSNKNCHSSLKA
jgi:hypothetical protein